MVGSFVHWWKAYGRSDRCEDLDHGLSQLATNVCVQSSVLPLLPQWKQARPDIAIDFSALLCGWDPTVQSAEHKHRGHQSVVSLSAVWLPPGHLISILYFYHLSFANVPQGFESFKLETLLPAIGVPVSPRSPRPPRRLDLSGK